MGFLGFGKKADVKEVDVGDVSIRESDGIHKAYIPEFLYKPPFGYPRKENIPLMRQLAKNPYVYGVIKTLADEAASTHYDIVYKEEAESTPELDNIIIDIKKFLDNPNKNKESFQHILRAAVKDICEVDSGVIVKVFNKKLQLVELFARDGGSFLINPDIYGYLGNRAEYVEPLDINYVVSPQSPDWSARLNQYTLEYKEAAAYFQYGSTAMALPVPFGRREIIYLMMNPQSNNIYGLSPVQILSDIIMTLVYGANYNLDFYMNSNMPEGIIQLLGANKDQIRAFRERFDSQFKIKDKVTGFMRKIGFKYPIINQEAKITPFQLEPKVMQILEQQEWFTKLVWSCFGVTPDEMGFCYSEDTRVLTNNGFKYYWELNSKDKIATIIEENNSIEYIEASSIETFDVKDRKFHHYKNNCVDILVSDNHRMYYRTVKIDKYRMSPSNEINVNTVKFLQGGLIWKGESLKEFKIPFVEYNNNKDRNREQQIIYNINDFCEFMGYYLSEGSVLKKMVENKQYPIKISQTNEEGIKIMTSLMDKLGFRRECDCWKINNKSLAIYLSNFGDSNNKYIPEELKNLPIDKLKILFNALIVGDGYRTEEGTYVRYSSNSKRLAEDVMEIMLKIGYKTSISVNEFKNKNWNTNYVVSGNLTQLEPRVIIDKQRSDVNYTGVMWCPVVKNRPFITERNGKLGIHYNTQDSNKAVSQTQSAVYKRKAVKPMLSLIKYHMDKEIIAEWGEDAFNNLEFKWDDYDLDEDIKRYSLLQMQISMGLKTSMMVAKEEGIDVEELKKQKEEAEEKENAKFEKQNSLSNPFGNEEEENPEEKPKEKKEKKEVEKKSFDNPLEKELVTAIKTRTKELMSALNQYKKGELDKIE